MSVAVEKISLFLVGMVVFRGDDNRHGSAQRFDAQRVWAVLSGIAAISAAIALRRDVTGEWPLPLAGILSLVFGGLLLVGPGAPPEPEWVIGPYAILFGMTLLVLGLRLRQLAEEMAGS